MENLQIPMQQISHLYISDIYPREGQQPIKLDFIVIVLKTMLRNPAFGFEF